MGEQERGAIVVSPRLALWVVAAAIVVGFLVGRAFTGSDARAAETGPDATATRSAELEELNRLRTQVAQTVVCTPPSSPTATNTPLPTATPTPVPPAAMGQPLSHEGDWTVVVKSFAAAPPAPGYTPAGKLVQVSATLTNNAATHRTFPFGDWVLVDSQGRTFQMVISATTQLHGPQWYLGSEPSLPIDFSIVFDVAMDAGPSFVLESRTDPTFRVALQLQVLG